MKRLIALLAAFLLCMALTDHAHAQACAPKLGSTIALRADSGKWLARCSGCQKSVNNIAPDSVTVSGSAPSGTALFKVVDAGGGKIGLQADSGKYVARCSGCVPGAPLDMLMVHSTKPWPITLVAQANGKCGMLLDNGQFAGRCNDCSPGATVADTVAVKYAKAANGYTQFEMKVISEFDPQSNQRCNDLIQKSPATRSVFAKVSPSYCCSDMARLKDSGIGPEKDYAAQIYADACVKK